MKLSLLFWILFSVILTASAQLIFKLEMSRPEVQELLVRGANVKAMQASLARPGIWAGLIFYGISAAVWLYVLGYVELSRAYPFVGLGFALTAVLAATLLEESFGIYRATGTAFVCVGVYLVGKS